MTSVDLFYEGLILSLRVELLRKITKLDMFEIGPSTIDLDFESIVWSWVKMSLSVDPLIVELDPELIFKFQVKMSRKICWTELLLILQFYVEMLREIKVFKVNP